MNFTLVILKLFTLSTFVFSAETGGRQSNLKHALLSKLAIENLAEISQYLDDPYEYVGKLDERSKEAFEKQYPRLFFLGEHPILPIAELANEEYKNDPELVTLFKYKKCYDKIELFHKLEHELLNDKFKNLRVLMARFLYGLYESFSEEERSDAETLRNKYTIFNGKFKSYLKEYLISSCEYKLFLEYFGAAIVGYLPTMKSSQIDRYYEEILNDTDISARLKEYLNQSSSTDTSFEKGKWLARAFLNKIPDDLIPYIKDRSDHILKSFKMEMLTANISCSDYEEIKLRIEAYLEECKNHVSGVLIVETRNFLNARYNPKILEKLSFVLGLPIEEIQKHCVLTEEDIKNNRRNFEHLNMMEEDYATKVLLAFGSIFWNKTKTTLNIQDTGYEMENRFISELKEKIEEIAIADADAVADKMTV